MISAIVLAAGESTRMGGQNKLLLPFGESTLLETLVDSVCASQAGETIVVLGHQAEQVRAKLKGRNTRLVENADYQEGMSSSIRAGLTAASASATGAMICLSDQPFMATSDFDELIGSFMTMVDKQILVPLHQGRRGNPVLFSMRYREEVMRSKGRVGG